MTVQEAIEAVRRMNDHIYFPGEPDENGMDDHDRLEIVLRAAEENEKNAEDAEKYRAWKWADTHDREPWAASEEFRNANGIDQLTKVVLAAYRAAQVEAAKKEIK